MKTRVLHYSAFVLLTVSAFAQNRIGSGTVDELYKTNCASCHGQNLEGGSAPSMLDGEWINGSSDASITESITKGFPDLGMVSWGDVLTPEQIRSLVIYIREKSQMADSAALLDRVTPKNGIYKSQLHDFKLEEVVQVDGILWSIDFMPDGKMIFTQRDGKLWLSQDGAVEGPIEGTPEVWQRGQGGLLEVALHPEYSENGWIYLSFSERVGGMERGKKAGMTAVARGRIRNGKWVDQEEIFHVPSNLHTSSGAHFGSRFVFKDGYLFFGIGDRGRMEMAQDLSKPNGKIYRIHDDGRIPVDNPFVKTEGAITSIWSFGHRNPQGLDLHPVSGALWETEHGPRGGDETNLIEAGNNYGWPEITYGMNYGGTPITDQTQKEGMEQPKHFWVPSIAVCGIDFYEGERFPKWQNNLLVAGMSSQELHRLVIDGDKVVEDEIVLKNQGRIRDVASGPDGLVYVLLNSRSPTRGRICRLIPTLD